MMQFDSKLTTLNVVTCKCTYGILQEKTLVLHYHPCGLSNCGLPFYIFERVTQSILKILYRCRVCLVQVVFTIAGDTI